VAVNAPICFKEQEIRNVGYVLKLFLAQKCGTFLVRLAFDRQPRSERAILHGHWQFDESEKRVAPLRYSQMTSTGPKISFEVKISKLPMTNFVGLHSH